MNGGKVVQIGKPLEVYRNPADTFVARFLGSPPMNLLPARLERQGARFVATATGGRYLVDGYAPEMLAPYESRAVTLGIRPEDLYETAGTHSTGARLEPIAVRVNAVEPLGAETLLVLATDSGDELIARIGRDTELRAGGRDTLMLDTAAIHLFDAETTAAIPRNR
jgi:ABC-type sugar transport system ATPase subunit